MLILLLLVIARHKHATLLLLLPLLLPLLLLLLLLQAEAFAISGQQNQVDTYARAVARAIQSGGGSATIAYASAFAQAFAGKYYFARLAKQRAGCWLLVVAQ